MANPDNLMAVISRLPRHDRVRLLELLLEQVLADPQDEALAGERGLVTWTQADNDESWTEVSLGKLHVRHGDLP